VDTLELTFEIVFFAIAIPAFIADVLAGVSERARQIGRISTGLLMLLGGAAVNATSLAVGVNYADFADDAKFGWVTDAWRAVVPGHAVLLIGLLVAFEVTVGVMILLGGRRAQAGLVGAIAFHVCLALFFSWFFTIYGLAMLLPLIMLLRAERRATTAPAHPRQKQPAQVGAWTLACNPNSPRTMCGGMGPHVVRARHAGRAGAVPASGATRAGEQVRSQPKHPVRGRS
jgi:hypothetical protein